MIYNTVSSGVILSKVYRDLKPNNTSWEADSIEWIGEALTFIGFHSGFKKREKNLIVKDYRVPFPLDFYNLIGVYYEGTKLPFGGDITSVAPYIDEAIYIAAKTEVLVTDNSFSATRYGSRLYGTTSQYSEYYTLVPNYIQTSFETGTISVKYNAWPIDKNGWPEVPDSPYYKQALFWYILRQMILGGFEHPNREFTYSFVDAQWKHYCVAAQNDAAFPTPDRAKRFTEMWVNLLPLDITDFDNTINQDTHGETI